MEVKPQSVLQDWVTGLTLMQQSVLLAATRGPDGIRKDHVAKLLLRWLRRCYLKMAFTGETIADPWNKAGGSFTGPSVNPPDGVSHLGFVGGNKCSMDQVVTSYLQCVDELPHHFQLHIMHAAEILGYKHPDLNIRIWWQKTYFRIVNDAHLEPELEDRMDYRLGDRESSWRDCEAGITAKGPE